MMGVQSIIWLLTSFGFLAASCVNFYVNFHNQVALWKWIMIIEIVIVMAGIRGSQHLWISAAVFIFFAVLAYERWRDADDDDDIWKRRKIKKAVSKLVESAKVLAPVTEAGTA